MDRGKDFLKSQINNAVMQHQTFIDNLVDHEKQAEDARYRALCIRCQLPFDVWFGSNVGSFECWQVPWPSVQ